jgi:hypothetical protein
LSEEEKTRQSEVSKAAAARQKEKAELEDDDGAGNAATQPVGFQVYPSVEPPAKRSIRQLGVLPDDVRCGHLEPIIGPVFEFDAYVYELYLRQAFVLTYLGCRYNDGVSGHPGKQIKSRQDRGVLDFDQQYNALVFVYYVDKGDGTFERKVRGVALTCKIVVHAYLVFAGLH